MAAPECAPLTELRLAGDSSASRLLRFMLTRLITQGPSKRSRQLLKILYNLAQKNSQSLLRGSQLQYFYLESQFNFELIKHQDGRLADSIY